MRGRTMWILAGFTLFVCALATLGWGCSQGSSEAENKGVVISPGPQRLRERVIKVKGIRIKAEIAKKPAEKAKGLMYRDSLGDNRGMLFVYDRPRKVKYYMRNVSFPISIAFIDEKCVIRQIARMQPREEMPVYSREAVKYVLEMNVNWFEKNNVGVGDKIELPAGL